ncbi:hypothetical protein FXO38_33975 [Capsicum annuum]|nr:hypothetical protein FXO38_33975 [Capsicum annuum]
MGRIDIANEGPAMVVLSTKLATEGLTNLFLQGDFQRKFRKSETTKYAIGIVEHMDLPISMRSVESPLQHARNALPEKNATMIARQVEDDVEEALFQSQICFFQDELSCERADNMETIQRSIVLKFGNLKTWEHSPWEAPLLWLLPSMASCLIGFTFKMA